MSLVARHAALTDIGLHRSTNEDAFVAEPPLFAVADGMGGAQAGEVASHLAARHARRGARGRRAPCRPPPSAANQAVYGQSRSDRSRAGMGTTLTAGLLRRRPPAVRPRRRQPRSTCWRDERLAQVTDDHSLVGEMVREGHLTREAAATHPQRSILSRALGTEPRRRDRRGRARAARRRRPAAVQRRPVLDGPRRVDRRRAGGGRRPRAGRSPPGERGQERRRPRQHHGRRAAPRRGRRRPGRRAGRGRRASRPSCRRSSDEPATAELPPRSATDRQPASRRRPVTSRRQKPAAVTSRGRSRGRGRAA